jgi:hypothetical protein
MSMYIRDLLLLLASRFTFQRTVLLNATYTLRKKMFSSFPKALGVVKQAHIRNP